MSAIAFKEADHTYWLDGRRLPGVTEILKIATHDDFRFVDPAVLARNAALGTAVHALIEADCKGAAQAAFEAAPFDALPYFDMWRHFILTSGFRVIASELRVHSPRYGYAGTLDLIGELNGRLALVDAKRTASVPRSAGPQTAAYEQAARESYPAMIGEGVTVDRFALHLSPSGWRLVPFRDRADLRVFLSCLTVLNWRNAE